ncbi:MAG: EFR1 family ferrodoxin, partial [Muribaculaceae bacterium]|nr:EFR1 family ferrodoxin [Muribaculaceae bacterium]
LSEDFVSGLREAKTPVWAVMTCGDETGDAPEILKASLEIRGLRLAGVWSVIMPNTYVLLPGFDVDPTEVELRKIEEAPARVDAIASSIKSGKFVADVHFGSMPRLKTRLIFPIFRHAGIFPSWWRFTEECVSCGKCAAVCPVGNVEMVAGHPRWHADCVSCLACYHACPVHAVAYGIMTGGKGQYHCKLH